MCVIIYKPKETTLLLKTVEDAWEQNPDGAGFAARVGKHGRWMIRKGFMKLGDFKDAVMGYQFNEMILHFRIATHGSVNPENTHPFYNERGESSVLFHNGILSEFGNRTNLSDSKDFFDRVVSKLEDEAAFHVLNMAASTNSSKFAFIGHSGKVYLSGDWSKHEGLEVSNLNFCGYKSFAPSRVLYGRGGCYRGPGWSGFEDFEDKGIYKGQRKWDEDGWRKKYARQLAIVPNETGASKEAANGDDEKIRRILESKAQDDADAKDYKLPGEDNHVTPEPSQIILVPPTEEELEELESKLDEEFKKEGKAQHVSEIIAGLMDGRLSSDEIQ